MQQRRLRLGDIVDDYCPRERRITNHAVVAMIEDDIKQTRCTTCEAEHEYKEAKLPTLRRKKDSVARAYKDVLAAVTTDATMQAAQAAAAEPEAAQPPLFSAPADVPPAHAPETVVPEPPTPAEPAEVPKEVGLSDAAPDNGNGAEVDHQGRVHRRLIRATLPRTDSQAAARPIPQFTMRQPQGRPGKFRAGGGRGPAGRPAAQGRNGTHPGGASRGPGFRAGAGRAPGGRNEGHRPARGGQPARHGKKFSK